MKVSARNVFKGKIAAFTFGTALTALAGPALAECELGRAVKLADGNWDAIQVLNSISAIILKVGYDCESEMVTGDMVPLFTALARNDIDIFLDVWISNNEEIWAETESKGAVNLGVLYPDATEGW